MTNTAIPQNSIEPKTRSAMVDFSLMLCVPLIVAIFIHGVSAIVTVAISVITCAILLVLGKFFFKATATFKDSSPFVVGVSVALLLPPTSPWWMTVITAVFAMGVCVLPFGTLDKAPFAPAVASICFATLCWPELLFNYSPHSYPLSKMLSLGISIDDNIIAVTEVLVGNVPSALGTGCILALIGSFLLVVVRRPKDSIPTITFILAVCLMAILFPRVATGRFISVVMELCSGMLFFCAVFFMSAPNNMPEKLLGKIVWGFVSGVICMVIRYVSPIEESVSFGILISCSMSDLFDKLPYTRKEKRKIKENEPYTEIEIITVVPDEIFNEIPDIHSDEPSNEIENTDEDSLSQPNLESESLESVVSEENAVNDLESPFVTGGDLDE